MNNADFADLKIAKNLKLTSIKKYPICASQDKRKLAWLYD